MIIYSSIPFAWRYTDVTYRSDPVICIYVDELSMYAYVNELVQYGKVNGSILDTRFDEPTIGACISSSYFTEPFVDVRVVRAVYYNTALVSYRLLRSNSCLK